MGKETKPSESHVFSACKGVFQGGGCKAVAYIGAYKEALDNGVVFSEVSGSSGGSIVAALIAAGATPEDLVHMIENFDVEGIRSKSVLFKVCYFFLNRVPKFVESLLHYLFGNSGTSYFAWRAKHAGEVKWKLWHFLVEGLHLALFGYIYEPDAFETYMDRLLRMCLGVNHTVRFKDLRLPLTVVTSDIRTHNYKVFSTWEHPEMSVAHAVAASAAIPGYFKPVDGRYVDGCIVSNLPVFSVVKDAVYDRVLTFTTDSKSLRAPGDLDTMEVVKQVAETIAQGGVDIQLASLPSAYNVRIPTEDYDILEFSILNNPVVRAKVIDLGAQTMRRVLKDWQTMRGVQFDSRVFGTDTDPLMQVAYLSRGAFKTVAMASRNTKWLERLFPLVVKWHNEGREVLVYCEKPDAALPACPVLSSASPAAEEACRREQLVSLGCEVREVEGRLPAEGFFCCYADDSYSCVLTRNADGSDIHEPADGTGGVAQRIYSHSSDRFLVCSAMASLHNLPCVVLPPELAAGVRMVLQPESPSVYIAELMSERRDFQGGVMRQEQLPLARMKFQTRYVSGYKFQNLHYLYEMYQSAHLAPFSSARLCAEKGTAFRLLPPIVLECDGEYVVLDGSAQVLYAYRKNIAHMDVFVVSGTGLDVAKERYGVSDIILTSRERSRFDGAPETPQVMPEALAVHYLKPAERFQCRFAK